MHVCVCVCACPCVPQPQVEDTSDVTVGGVVLPETAKERPLSGTVVRVGPGKYDPSAEGQRKPMTVGSVQHSMLLCQTLPFYPVSVRKLQLKPCHAAQQALHIVAHSGRRRQQPN